MANERLGEKNIEQLLAQYRSERARLIFQLDKVRDTIAELKAMRPKDEPSVEVPVVKRGRGRPRKDATLPGTTKSGAAKSAKKTKKTAKKPRRKKRKKMPEGYRMSNWDTMVLDAITKAGLLMRKEDLLHIAKTWAAKNEPELGEGEVEAKLTRVLQKLAGKSDKLGTHRTGLQRGYHYGLKDWFFASTGALRRQHLDRLVISKD
jgi:hypothetical protein